MNKLKKRILALGMALVMTVSMIPMFASLALADEAPATINVYLTVSNQGELAKANDGAVMAWKEVTVTDLDKDGKFTFDEALVAAHEAYNSAEGYAVSGGQVSKLWGVSATTLYFFINDVAISSGVTQDDVDRGDFLVASILKDSETYSDYYSFFDKKMIFLEPEEAGNLILSGFPAMSWGSVVPEAISEASLGYYTADGTYTALDLKPDKDGLFKVSFDKPGVYYITAAGTIKDTVATDYNLLNEAHMAESYPAMYQVDGHKFVAFTDTEGGMSYMYTVKDYKDGPYPVDEIQYVDILDYFADAEEYEDYFFLTSNQLLKDAVTIAPACMVTVTTPVLDYTGKDINFISETGAQFGMFSAGDGTIAVDRGDKVVVHYVLNTTKKTYTGVHLGPITDIPANPAADMSEYTDILINDDMTMDFSVSKDLCGKMIPIAPLKAKYGAGRNSTVETWTSGEQYYLAIPAAENLDHAIDLALTNNCGSMFLPEAVSISGKEGAYILHLTMGSESLDSVFVGFAHLVDTNKALTITRTGGKGYVDIPVKSIDKQIVLAFHGRSWTNRGLTIDLEKKTAVYDPVKITLKEIDDLTTEQAVAKAKDLATVELVNLLIEAIQVQYRDENTDKYCTVAKAFYDALKDEDKEKLDDPGYFGDNTGDASLDDPRNTGEIGEKELLVVSFGTSFNDSRVATIKAVEDALAKAYPEYSVRRAFTAQIIINHIQSRDGEVIDNMEQALDRAVDHGVKELVVQPTHLMHGAEYDEMCEALAKYEDKFDKIIISEPLLSSDDDKTIVAKAVVNATIKDSDYDSLDAAEADKTAIVFMGHGTSHEANVTYSQMQEIFDGLGYKNVFVGTVEGKPESTALPAVKKAVEDAGYTKVILRPLMVVAGDHANNDMAADEEGSWYYAFANGGEFEVEGADEPVDIGEGFGKDNVTCQIKGLGEIEEVQQLYVAHVAALPADYTAVNAAIAKAKTLDSNLYTVKSFEKVVEAVKAVVEGKNILQQEEVDAMAKAIEDALEGLVKVYTDVADPDAWYYEVVYDITEVKNANGRSLMSGYADGSGKFGATAPLTRQDFAIILYRLADEPGIPEMENPFSDVSESGYYYESVLWAKAENVISGYENGKFGVGDKITREQVATILYRFATDYLKLETTEEGDLSKFSDGTAISSWAKDALTWATGAGIITGKDNGTKIDARGNAARAEIAAMILRFLEYHQKKKYDEVIAIVHTNDVHGQISVEPYVKGLADKLKESGDYSLVLTVSAGDVYSGGEAVAGYYNGELIPAIEDQVYDVIVPGNNDFPMDGFKGNVLLTSLYKHTKTICANLQVKEDTDMAAYAAAYTAKIGNEDFAKMYEGVELKEDGSLDCSALNLGVIKAGTSPWDATMIVETEKGTKLGLFGLSSTFMGSLQGTVAAAKESVASLKEEGVDAIVGIGHTGWLGEGSTEPTQVNDTNSWVVASEVQDMDAFIDSHSHSIINDGHGCYVGDNKVLVNQASSFGSYIGVMYLYLKDGQVVNKTAELIGKEEYTAITPDEDVQATVDAALERIRAIAGDPLVTTPYYLNGGTDFSNPGGHVRANETNMGDFLTDVIRAAASEKRNKDYAFVCFPGYSIRGSVDENVSITNIELSKIFAFYVALGEKVYNAEEIVTLVTDSLTAVNPSYGAKFMQMSGINVTFTNDNGKGTPVTIKVGDTLIYDANKGGIQVNDDWSVVALRMLHNNDRVWEGEEADLFCKDQDEVKELVHWYLETHELGKDYTIYPNTIAPDNRIVEVK